MSSVFDPSRQTQNAAGDVEPADRRPVLTAQELVDLIEAGRSADAAGYRVVGDVRLTGRTVTAMVDLPDVEFADKVHFDHCRFENYVNLSGCRFDGGLTLANSSLNGPLTLDGATFGRWTEVSADLPLLRVIVDRLSAGAYDERWQRWADRLHDAEADHPGFEAVADLTNLRVTGRLSLLRVHVFGSLVAHYLTVTNDVMLGGARIFGDVILRRATLGELRTDTVPDDEPLRIDGDLVLDAVDVAGDILLVRPILGGHLQCDSAIVKGNLTCRASSRRRARLRESILLRDARISGSVDIRGCQILGELDLTGIHVDGGFDAGRSGKWGLKVGGALSAWNAQFHSQVNLAGCTISGDVTLTNVTVRSEVRLDQARLKSRLNLSASQIGADVNLTGTRISGAASFVTTRISLNLIFDGATCEDSLQLDSISVGAEARFVNSVFTGNINLQGANIEGVLNFTTSSIEGSLEMTIAHIGSDMYIETCSISDSLRMERVDIRGQFLCLTDQTNSTVEHCLIGTDVWMLGATIGGYLAFYGVTISRNLVLQNSVIGRSLQFLNQHGVRTKIGGNIHVEASKIFSDVEIYGLDFEGEVFNLSSAQIGSNLLICYDVDVTPELKLTATTMMGHLTASSATIGGSVEIIGLKIRSISSGTDQRSARPCGIDFSGARINGRFLFYSPDSVIRILRERQAENPRILVDKAHEETLFAEARQHTVDVQGDVCLAQVQIGGDLVLDGLKLTGRLDLRDANIQRNLLCRPIHDAVHGDVLRASANETDFETLDAAGDAVLTGLTTAGDLILRDVRIRGRLELFPLIDAPDGDAVVPATMQASRVPDPRPAHEVEEQFARIAGNLLLNAAEIGHVILSGRGFGVGEPPILPLYRRIQSTVAAAWSQHDYLLTMYALRGGHFEDEAVPDRLQGRGAVTFERARIRRLTVVDPLPGMVDLNGLEVGRWDERAGFFKKMLDRSHPFGQSNYTAIENQLRNQGRNEQADEIHVSMRRRDRRSTRNRWKVFADWFIDFSTKYGTTSARLFWIMTAFFVVTFFVFLDPEHVEYEIAPLANQPPPVLHPVEWSASDAAFLAVRLHVPIVSLGADDKLQPSGTLMKSYAMAVMAGSWVMWPLFIASASGLLRKRS